MNGHQPAIDLRHLEFISSAIYSMIISQPSRAATPLNILIAFLLSAMLLVNAALGLFCSLHVGRALLQLSRARIAASRTSTALVLASIALVVCRRWIDPSHSFIRSSLPVHARQPDFQRALFNPATDIVESELISEGMCDRIVAAAEAYTHAHGWTTNRHAKYPTTDIPLQVCAL